jgi:hypothetical protein
MLVLTHYNLAGCSDMYFKSLDCQWIDITDSPNGYYWLTVSCSE